MSNLHTELPTCIRNALKLLHLNDINISTYQVNKAYKEATEQSFFINREGDIQAKLSLADITTRLEAKKLLIRFINTGTFKFNCYNCAAKTNWDISLYIEVDNILLCHTCQNGVEKLRSIT